MGAVINRFTELIKISTIGETDIVKTFLLNKSFRNEIYFSTMWPIKQIEWRDWLSGESKAFMELILWLCQT